MATICKLPYELLHIINESLKCHDTSNLARSCRFLYAAINPVLYRNAKDRSDVLSWAAERGVVGTMKKLLAEGADPRKNIIEERIREPQQTLPQPTPDILAQPVRLHDYQLQLMLLEQQNRRRRNRQEEEEKGKRGCHTALHIAAQAGHDKIIELLLDHGVDIDAKCKRVCQCQLVGSLPDQDHRVWTAPLWTALHLAICHRHLSTAKLLMCRGASFNVSSWEDDAYDPRATALHCASASGNVGVLGAIMSYYLPDVNTPDGNGVTPLRWAYQSGKIDAMELLLKNGANIDTPDSRGRSLLVEACATSRFDDAIWLVQHGADANFKDGEAGGLQATAMNYICDVHNMIYERVASADAYGRFFPERLAVAKALLEAGADVNMNTGVRGRVPLVTAAKDGHFALVKLLLDHGANVDAYGSDGATALVTACCPSRFIEVGTMKSIFELLLDRGASVHMVSALEETALQALCTFISYQISRMSERVVFANMVARLLKHGHSPDAARDDITSPMLQYFLQGQTQCCKLLLEHNARTPPASELRKMIAHAIRSNDAEATRFVLSLPGAKNLMATPARLFTALKGGANNVVDILIDNGAPHAHVSKDGWSCLNIACNLPVVNIRFIRKLLEAGANPNVMTTTGITPLKAAINHEQLAVVELLLEFNADPDLTRSDDPSPLMLACQDHRTAILEALLRRSSKPLEPHCQEFLRAKAASLVDASPGGHRQPTGNIGTEGLQVNPKAGDATVSGIPNSKKLRRVASTNVSFGRNVNFPRLPPLHQPQLQ